MLSEHTLDLKPQQSKGKNKIVDELAEEAENKRSSARANLPPLLSAPLPVSASTTKQAYYSKLKNSWDIIWDESERSRS